MVAFYDEYDTTEQPKTLTEWVRNFRIKRVQMRRKLRGDLRVSAILSTALLNAEQELRRKQQERFSRWLEMQAKFVPHGKTHCGSDAELQYQSQSQSRDRDESKVEAATKAAAENERREVESNLWKSELSGLDDFMRSLSSNSSHHNNNKNLSNNGGSSNSTYNNNSNQHQCAIAVNS